MRWITFIISICLLQGGCFRGRNAEGSGSSAVVEETTAVIEPDLDPLSGPEDMSGDINTLVDGITQIPFFNYSSALMVYGMRAAPLVAYKEFPYGLGAIARWGQGRVAVLGSEAWLAPATDEGASLLQARLLKWLAGDSTKSVVIGGAKNPDAIALLMKHGFNVSLVDKKLSELDRPLTEFGLVVIGSELDPSDVEAIRNFVARGHGLYHGAKGWVIHSYFNNGKPLAENSISQLLAPMGIRHTEREFVREGPKSIVINRSVMASKHYATVLKTIYESIKNQVADSNEDLVHAGAVLGNYLSNNTLIPEYPRPKDLSLMGEFLRLQATRLNPTPENPIKPTDSVSRAAMTMRGLLIRSVPEEEIDANPDAEVFPGLVPKSYPRITELVTLDLAKARWNSTGLYLSAGEIIEVTTSEQGAAAGIKIRIGAHSDSLWSLKEPWRRWPEVTVEKPLDKTKRNFSTTHGGLVYLVAPQGATGKVEVTISGVTRAPTFEFGKTTAKEWQEVQTQHPAPWGEIITDRFILTLPRKILIQSDDPTAVAQWWQKAASWHVELSQRPPFAYAERYVQDEQVIAGYLHAGYPTAGTHYYPKELINIDYLQRGEEWGVLHELGHNQQQGPWTPIWAVEVTCNIFTVYTKSTMTGKQVWDDSMIGYQKPEVMEYLKNPNQATWYQSSTVALWWYLALQREFGWEPFKAVFASYRDHPPNPELKSDLEKHDEWLRRMSKQLSRNLVPYFQQWGVPLSEAAKAEVNKVGWEEWRSKPIDAP